MALMQASLDELAAIKTYLEAELIANTGHSDPVLAQIDIAQRQANTLDDIAAYQKAQTEYIQSTQAAELKRIADEQQRQTEYIQTTQAAQEEAIATRQAAELAAIEAQRAAQLASIEMDRAQAVRALKYDMVYALTLIQYELQRLFAVQYKATTGVELPTPVFTPPAFAQGGMVPAMMEPGERVFTPPMSHAQQGALMAMNTALPRFASGGFTVPGSGSGDTVPAMLPSGSFILNKRAAGAMGYQGGGSVSGGEPSPVIHHHHYSFPNLTIRSQNDLEELKRGLREIERRRLGR